MKTKLFNRNFTMVVIGQLISLFGNSILRFALSLYVLDITGSATIFGTVTAFAIIPTIILSPFGGMIADRVNRRNIMVALDFTTAFLVLGFGFTLSEHNAVPFIAVMLILLSIIQSFYTPSVQSSVPLLQSEENLVKSNSIVNQVTMLANLIGPVLGGLLYGFFGAMPIIFVSGICFFLSAILEIFIRIPFEKRETKSNMFQTAKSDFKESMTFMVKDQPDILKTMLFIAAFNFFVASIINIGMPYMIRTVLGLSSGLYGVAEGLMAGAGIVGGIISGLIASKFKTRKLYVLLISSGISIIPIGLVFLLGLIPMVSYGVITACVMLLQLIFTIFSIFTLSATQKKTPNHLLGKVTAYIMTLTMCAQPIGQALYGVLFDVFSNNLYVLLIITGLIAAFVGLLSKRTFYRLDS